MGLKKADSSCLILKPIQFFQWFPDLKLTIMTHLMKKQAGVENMMLKQQIIGSVFKTVVAAAAIDYNLDDPTRLFDCSRKINGDPDLSINMVILIFRIALPEAVIIRLPPCKRIKGYRCKYN